MKNIIKKIAIVSSMAVGLAAVGQANANTISLPRAVTGTVTVSQSATVDCTFSGTLRQRTDGRLEIANPAFGRGNILCGTVVRPNAGPWIVDPVVPLTGSHSNVAVSISGVGATTILGGSCTGTITGKLNDNGSSGHTLVVDPAPQTLPGTPSSCQVISGTFNF